eukprot:364558-Chlamydomonas_euryale.AAC.5
MWSVCPQAHPLTAAGWGSCTSCLSPNTLKVRLSQPSIRPSSTLSQWHSTCQAFISLRLSAAAAAVCSLGWVSDCDLAGRSLHVRKPA